MALSMKDLESQIEELRNEVIALKEHIATMPKGRDRGPVSEGVMTDEHAVRVMLGDLKDKSHKEAALVLKLSYGQIYSARKGYTFKPVYQRMLKGEIDNTYDAPTTEAQESEA